MGLRHLTLVVLVSCAMLGDVNASRLFSPGSTLNKVLSSYSKHVAELKKTIADLSRQVMLQQFFVEEKIRGDGNSGVKIIRGGRKGYHNYDASSHLSTTFMSIHDHSNYDRLVGMGELSVVLNGLEFRTRHNDYKLYMPNKNSPDYDAVTDIPFPGVPPEVTNIPTVEGQVTEMREWFRAYWTQNTTHRDYRPYFKPVIAYLEGGWTYDSANISESFASDRHALAASSWFELQEKVRFSAMSGVKDLAENLAYLPTTITHIDDLTGKPTYAQWNYRIMCYPLDEDLPFSNIRQVEDLGPRLSNDWTRREVMDKRTARFQLWDKNQDPNNWYSLLDRIMYKIPGKDNAYKDLTQDVFGNGFMYDIGQDNVKLDTGRYHRWYRSSEKDAMGISTAARGFNDDYLFVAQTSQPKVASLTINDCKRRNGKSWCEDITNSFTYAIPMEIIFLTPLLEWNPYNLKYHNEEGIATKAGSTTLDGSKDRPYNGVDSKHFYITPANFFSGFETDDAADTVRNAVYVRQPDGTRALTTSSGTQIMLQTLEGIGRVRTRFPIAPVHGEGSSVWRELNALKDLVLGDVNGPPEMVEMQLQSNGSHTHSFKLPYADFLKLVDKRVKTDVTTESSDGHTHLLQLLYSATNKQIKYNRCDAKYICDNHPKDIKILNPSVHTELPG